MRILLAFFLSTSLFASEQDLHIKELNGQYRAPNGSGEVKELQLPTRDRFNSPVRIELQKDDQNFSIQLNGRTFH